MRTFSTSVSFQEVWTVKYLKFIFCRYFCHFVSLDVFFTSMADPEGILDPELELFVNTGHVNRIVETIIFLQFFLCWQQRLHS